MGYKHLYPGVCGRRYSSGQAFSGDDRYTWSSCSRHYVADALGSPEWKSHCRICCDRFLIHNLRVGIDLIKELFMAASALTPDGEIVSDSSLRHGEPIVAGTATPVRAVAELWNLGMSPEEIPVHLPHLTLQMVFAALHYYSGHRQEIDTCLTTITFPRWRQLDFPVHDPV